MDTVAITCSGKQCSLSCKLPFMIFDAESQMWNNKKIGCNRRGFVPKTIKAACIAGGSKTAFNIQNLVKTPCRNTVFEKYSISPTEVTATCKNSYCHVKCIATDAAPTYTWPDGTVTKRDVFKCQKGTMWKPNGGTLSCP